MNGLLMDGKWKTDADNFNAERLRSESESLWESAISSAIFL